MITQYKLYVAEFPYSKIHLYQLATLLLRPLLRALIA